MSDNNFVAMRRSGERAYDEIMPKQRVRDSSVGSSQQRRVMYSEMGNEIMNKKIVKRSYQRESRAATTNNWSRA